MKSRQLDYSLEILCSTTIAMSVVDFERRLEDGRGVEIWVMELWGVFQVGPSWPPI